MTAATFPQRTVGPAGLLRPSLLVAVVAGLVLITLRWPWPSQVPPFRASNHAEQRHGKEQVPPEAIRACILGGVFMEFAGSDGTASAGKVARLCQYAANRIGMQIGWFTDRAWQERTAFYGTVCRVFHIVSRDGYVLSNTSDPVLHQMWLAFVAGQLCHDPSNGS